MQAAKEAPAENGMTESDRKWGYKFGCDGLRSVTDAAKFLGKSRQTIYRWVDEGKLRMGKGGVVCVKSMRDLAHSLER